MRFQQRVNELLEYVEKWSTEIRQEFKLGEINPNLIREALEPVSQVMKLKAAQRVAPGHYQSLDLTIQIHVLSQDMESGLIVFEMLNREMEDKFQTMSPGIFFATFQPADDNAYLKDELLAAYQHTDVASESQLKTHLKDREASFAWPAINVAYGKMAERYTELYDSVLKENVEALKADYLELLFLAFVLGNRLGFSPRNQFHALYVGVFALADTTWEECQTTIEYYEALLIETAFEKIELYDPAFEMAKPLTYFITYSVRDQMGTDKLFYPKNCFMPSRGLANKLAGG